MEFLSISSSSIPLQSNDLSLGASHYSIVDGGQVWIVNLRKNSYFLYSQKKILSRAEHERSVHFRFSIDHEDYINSHVALRILLGAHLNERPEHLQVIFPYMRRPFLKNKNSECYISISRRNGIAMIGLHMYRHIGVDIEQEYDFDGQFDLILKYASQSEKNSFFHLNSYQKRYAFWRWWVAKEACLKAMGTGFSYNPRNISVNFFNESTFIKVSPIQLGIEVSVESLYLGDEKYSIAVAIK